VKRLLALLACVGAASCVHPVGLSDIGYDGCVRKQCAQEGDPTGRAACESACRQKYQR
jgi:hypothetical protein